MSIAAILEILNILDHKAQHTKLTTYMRDFTADDELHVSRISPGFAYLKRIRIEEQKQNSIYNSFLCLHLAMIRLESGQHPAGRRRGRSTFY
jgi:hypothetical protein